MILKVKLEIKKIETDHKLVKLQNKKWEKLKVKLEIKKI